MKEPNKIERKDYIKSLFTRSMIKQKSKIEPNKILYKRKKYNMKQEEI